jgi:hypothetical protein
MEYKLASASTWTAISGTSVTSLAAGSYEVRFKGKVDGGIVYTASPAKAVTVTDGGGEPPTQVQTPTATPNGGSFNGSVEVRLSSTTGSASIYYTTDGTVPTDESTAYTAAFLLTETTTVKAIATKSGMTDSAVMSVTFTKETAPPTTHTITFNSNGGTAVADITNVTSGNKISAPTAPIKAG